LTTPELPPDHEPAEIPSWGDVPPPPLVALRSHARAAGEDDHTSLRPLMRPIAAWRLDCGRFAFDSAFVSPHARHEIPALLRLHERHPDAPMSIFGHADPTGDDVYNKRLSGRRARVMHALLLRDVDEWERIYGAPMPGDAWGVRTVQLMLATLTDSEGVPYYQGDIDGYFGSGSQDGLRAYQAQHQSVDGAPLDVDGNPGPMSRKSLFKAYMDWLCTDDMGNTLLLTDENFLARGSDADRRGDVQGCSEFNPMMVFSTDEHAKYQSYALKQERDDENACNRRVVVFLYPDGVRVDPDHWPCPAAESGAGECQKRFWSDHAPRRNPQALRRNFDGDFDTFGCRFYHYFGNNTPAETPIHLGLTFDVYLHRKLGQGTPSGRFSLVSDDDEVNVNVPASAAVLIEGHDDREVRCLSFTGLRRGKHYTLSFMPSDADPEYEPVVLVAEFRLEDFTSTIAGADSEGVAYVAGDDGSSLAYEPPPYEPDSREPPPPDPDSWAVEGDEVEWDGLKVTLTTVREDELAPIGADEDDDDG